MNIRDHLNRRLVPAFLAMLGCFAMFALGGVIASRKSSLGLVALLGFVGFGACIFFIYYGVRCPSCRNPLGQLTYLPRGGYFRLSQNVCFCPFCGISLDCEVGEDGKPIDPQDRPVPKLP